MEATLPLLSINLEDLALPRGSGMLYIRRPVISLDTLASRALKGVAGAPEYRNGHKAVKRHITEKALTANISRVTARLNKAGLDKTTRLLLSEETVYGSLLFHALVNEKIKGEDDQGLFESVLRNMDSTTLKLPREINTAKSLGEVKAPKIFFHMTLVNNVLAENSVQLSEPLMNLLHFRVLENGVSLAPSKLESQVLDILNRVREDGTLPYFVERYFKERREVSPQSDQEAIRNAMIAYLRRLNLNITSVADFDDGKYDEYFAVGYDHALTVISGGEDPVTSIYNGSMSEWDYTVDTFASIEEQGISRENILAAGALYYVFVLGEQLAVFRLVDALILRWAAGGINIPKGTTASKLYRYYKLRDQRSTPEERAMVYKRVLNIGDSKMLSNMVVNEDFPLLWDKLMTEVVDYIQKSESSVDTQASKLPIYQATRDLQHNLTSHMTGMAHLQVTESYAQLRDSFDLLGNSEVVDYFAGGPDKNMWSVIERLWQEEFNALPNISSLRTAAVEGNKIFQWIADFDEGSVTDDQFQEFLHSTEAHIIARAEEQPENNVNEDEEDISESDDDFDDWDN